MADDFERRVERLERGSGGVVPIIQFPGETTEEVVRRKFPGGTPPGVELIILRIYHEPTPEELVEMNRGPSE